MAAGLFLALYYVKHSLERADTVVLVAVYFILLKLALVVALAMLFSCFTTPLLAILFTAGLYVAGLFVHEMRGLQTGLMSPALAALLRGISYLLPNFENFDVMGAAAHGRAIPGALIGQNTLYAALYCAMVLMCRGDIFAAQSEMSAKSQIALLLLVALGFAGVWNLQKHIDAQQAAWKLKMTRSSCAPANW